MTLVRMNSRTPLQPIGVLPMHSKNQFQPASTSLASTLLPVAHFLVVKRRPRNRMALFAVVALVLLSGYIACLHYSYLPSPLNSLRQPFAPLSSSSRSGSPVDALTLALQNIRKAKTKIGAAITVDAQRSRTQITLSQEEELAAVSSFIASLPQNVIPLYVNPEEPIDPQLILDFDTRGPRAREEVQVMVEDVWTRNPVFLYAKHYSSVSREVKRILDSLRLLPEPTIVDIDLRDDVGVLKPLIARLCSTEELPILLVGGQNVGSLDQIRLMAENGELKKLIAASGATVDANKGRKKKH